MKKDKPFAFVLMPFDSKFDDIYKLGIKETASGLGIHAERVDEQIYSEGILERIYRQIELADIIIADMTDQNANVFYEVGYAHAKDKICILLTQNAEDIPFDLRHKRHIIYEGSIQNLKTSLADDLSWALKEIENVRTSRIKVTLDSAEGSLEKTKYRATAEVTFKIDLLNESNKATSQIDACYFYTGKGWTLYQEGEECPSTHSDLPDFKARHFLKSPINKLQSKQWAQLRFKAKKVVGSAFGGEELKDSYKISGRSSLRITTNDGNFDYELNVDTEAEDVPF